MRVVLGSAIADQAQANIDACVEAEIASKIYDGDSSLWGSDAQPEASIRLGWTNAAKNSLELVPEILKLRDELHQSGITRVVLCGMGGSSLAPEVICKTNQVELVVLDSTSPAQVAVANKDIEKTVVVVSSKSGGTVETDSQKRFFEQAFSAAGISPQERIVVVTDPGSPLDVSSREAGYRVFNADPNVGGRYSALTAFGLVPSGLAGADIAKLLAGAIDVSPKLAYDSPDNPAIMLASALADEVRDKFILAGDFGSISGFGDWVEQLVAESTGKLGLGVLPVVGSTHSPEFKFAAADVTPVIHVSEEPAEHQVTFSGELGELFQLFSTATAMLGWLLKINPFDQPDVESAKVAARALLDTGIQGQSFDHLDNGFEFSYSGFTSTANTVEAAMADFLNEVDGDCYLSVQAYLSRPHFPEFESLRDLLAEKLARPVTFGWGPRFLHSTGQYHKGGKPQGVFLQLVTDDDDLEIPGREFSFQQLISAQAAGDAAVLAEHNRPVLRIKLNNPNRDLETLRELIG